MRWFVTGTDTDVGKTRVTAAVARGLSLDGKRPTIVKLAQTGVTGSEPGDAAVAAALAGCAMFEVARFAHPADPWSAALHAGQPPLHARRIADTLDTLAGPLVLEGAGGAAVPLNASDTLTTVAAYARSAAIVVVGLRLGCINHAVLTLAYLHAHAVPVHGAVFVERWAAVDPAYRDEVRRGLDAHVRILGVVEHDEDASRSVARAASLFRSL